MQCSDDGAAGASRSTKLLDDTKDLPAFQWPTCSDCQTHLLVDARKQWSWTKHRKQRACQRGIQTIETVGRFQCIEGRLLVAHVGGPLGDMVRIRTRCSQCQQHVCFPHWESRNIGQGTKAQLNCAIGDTTCGYRTALVWDVRRRGSDGGRNSGGDTAASA